MTLSPTTNDPLIGKILAERYRITELVGSGRFSIVYKGQHLFMDRAVAMKTLQSNLAEDQTVIKRFEKEAVALSKLRHPNIVSVYDCFVHTNGQPFLVMDFLDGHTLEELLTDRGAIPPKLMRAIVFQASAGLAHAHGSGVLHRDIKPDNIILLPREKTDERVRLLDFGFALLQGDLERLTLSGTLCGSPAYISPERWKGKELDARSDIYSLAVVMFQGLTGQLPFKAASLEELRDMHVGQEPPTIGEVIPALKDDQVSQSILNKALAKDPEDRYQTMKEFHNAVKLWSPNSDDAEIAQWAKNVMPKQAPQTVAQPAVTAQPISLQPMPQQGTAPAGNGQVFQGPGQPLAGPPQANLQPNQPPRFDEAATLQNHAVGPTFDEIETLQSGKVGQDAGEQSFVEMPDPQSAVPNASAAPNPALSNPATPNSAVPGQPGAPIPNPAISPDPAQRTVEVSLEQGNPLSPEALARIQKPNPRASLTKQDVAYIKAIAQTLGDSLGDQFKAGEPSPLMEGSIPPRDETSKLSFPSMPAPPPQPGAVEPGPKIVPAIDRRQKRTGEGSGADGAAGTGYDTAGGAQADVASEWSAKQEVAPWVSNPDDFKPRSGFGEPASFGNNPQGPAPFGNAQGPQANAPGQQQNAPGPQANSPGSQTNTPGPVDNPFIPFNAPPSPPPGSPPASNTSPAPFSPTTSSSRISPMMPSPTPSTELPAQPNPLAPGAAAPPSAVPWTNAQSSAPADFGKMLDDKLVNPGAPGPAAKNPMGTEIASPTASTANLSVASGNERPVPPKGEKKSRRLPTFVDRDTPADEPDSSAPPAKKGMGMVIAGAAVAVFVLGGIGIATWLLTNVNPPADSNTNSAEVVPMTSGGQQAKDKPAEAVAVPITTDTAKPPAVEKPAKPAKAPKAQVAKSAPVAEPAAEAVKEQPNSKGWFGIPSFNKPEESKPAAKPSQSVTAQANEPSSAPKPKKKKQPKKKKPAVARSSGGSSGGLSGGYVEVEVTPGRRAYRSY